MMKKLLVLIVFLIFITGCISIDEIYTEPTDMAVPYKNIQTEEEICKITRPMLVRITKSNSRQAERFAKEAFRQAGFTLVRKDRDGIDYYIEIEKEDLVVKKQKYGWSSRANTKITLIIVHDDKEYPYAGFGNNIKTAARTAVENLIKRTGIPHQ